MISLEERQKIAAMIEQARCDGARLKAACDVVGIDARTLQRWEANAGLRDGDARPRAVRPVPAHALSLQEREQILRIANEPRSRDLRLCRPRALCPRWRTKASISPANPASAGCCELMVKLVTVDVPRRLGVCDRPPPMWPLVRDKCGHGI